MYRRNFANERIVNRQKRSAVAAVEMAFLAPIFALFMTGMFELSRGVMVKQTLTGAARKGCRTGILSQSGNSDIINDATDVMQDNGFSSSQFDPSNGIGAINITVTDPNGNTVSDAILAPAGSMVSVQVVIPSTSMNLVSYFFLTSSTVESDIVVMMKQ